MAPNTTTNAAPSDVALALSEHPQQAGPTGSASGPLRCADRHCSTGMEMSEGNSRKVISDFFGRNKKATSKKENDPVSGIDPAVWHRMCRKSYQRAKYQADKGVVSHCRFYHTNLTNQLLRIRLWRPNATFKIQLQKAAKTRLNEYHAHLRRNGNDRAAAETSVAVAEKTNKKGKTVPLPIANAVKMHHADHIEVHFAGENKSVSFLLNNLLPWIWNEVENGDMERMPPVEFLLNDAVQGETANDPADNYDRWCRYVDSDGASEATTTPKKKLKLHGPRHPSGPSTTPIKRERTIDFDDGSGASSQPKRSRLTLKVRPRISADQGALRANERATVPPNRPEITESTIIQSIEPAPPLSPFKAPQIQVTPQRIKNFQDLPAYVPPPPVVRQPAAQAQSPPQPQSSPIMARGMVYGGGKRAIPLHQTTF